MSHRKTRIIYGNWILRTKLKFKKGDYYFVKNKHLGDIVRTLPAVSLFSHYKAHEPNKKIIVLIEEKNAGISEMNPDIDEIRIMPSDELRALSDYLDFHFGKSRMVFGIICRWLPNKFHDSIFPDATSVLTILPVYGIPPAFASENKELAKIPQTLSDASVARGIRFISDHHLDPQKVLILVPYARSSSSIPCGELDGVVDFYHKHGFKVYTTTIGQEKPVDKTEPLSISADVLFSLISQGAVVIGVQCGLIDVCEWMHLTNRIIKVYLLIRDPDYLFFGNRKGDLSRRIEKKEYDYTIAVSSEEDRKSLGNDIIELSRNFLD